MIIIVDYGMGNLFSIQKAFKRINVESKITSDSEEIFKANKLLLPGVGHFEKGMENIKKTGMLGLLNKKVLEDKTPILGICLGMQLMTKFSEEGDVEGIGWIDAKTCKFNYYQNKKLKIPHMGWNSVLQKKKSKLFYDISEESLFYFVHSYYVNCERKEDVLATTNYMLEFDSSFEKDNIFATQFHPEKSHQSGLKLLQNFANL